MVILFSKPIKYAFVGVAAFFFLIVVHVAQINELTNENDKLTRTISENDFFKLMEENKKNPEMDKGFKNYLATMINFHGLQKYHWIYEDIDYPIKDLDSTIVFSEYAPRILKGAWQKHRGIDIVSLYDYRCYSSINGFVHEIKINNTYGLHVIIENEKYRIIYAHLETTNLKPYDNIHKGEMIGIIGATGDVEGIHLHFAIQVKKNANWYSTNPVRNSTWGIALDVTENEGLY